MTTERQREWIALTVFVIVWCGGWTLPYTWTHESVFLWVGPAVLGGAGIIIAIVDIVYDWIYR